MVDHRRTLGKSGHGYPCYVLKLEKIALVAVSRTRSSAAIDRVFRCTAIDEFTGAGYPLRGYEHMALTVGQWQL